MLVENPTVQKALAASKVTKNETPAVVRARPRLAAIKRRLPDEADVEGVSLNTLRELLPSKVSMMPENGDFTL